MEHIKKTCLLLALLTVPLVVGSIASARPNDELPPITRHVPRHPESILDGCGVDARRLIWERLDEAISIGAPAYNDGDFEGCYRTYEAAARRLESDLPASCQGPVRALGEGRAIARQESTSAARAWAMRDAFDGLLIVVDRTTR
ncbi:MAG: hypothetical protein AB7S26_25640 [Sandaracinaceae bacterium]